MDDNGWREHKREIFEKFNNLDARLARIETMIENLPRPGESPICCLHQEKMRELALKVMDISETQRKLGWGAGALAGLGSLIGWFLGWLFGGKS